MFSHRLVVASFVALIFLSAGCSNIQSDSVNDVKAPKETPPTTTTTTKQNSADVVIRGHFKRSFEVHELEAHGKIYYVADPMQLLMKQSNSIGQDGYVKSFDACVIGTVGSKGGYGPTGKYEHNITVSEVCI